MKKREIRNRRLNFKVSETEHAIIKAVAKRNNTTISNVLRTGVARLLADVE